MKPSERTIKNLKALAMAMPPTFRLVKASPTSEETPVLVDHFKVMLKYHLSGKKDKLDRYINEVCTINQPHNAMIAGMQNRLQSII